MAVRSTKGLKIFLESGSTTKATVTIDADITITQTAGGNINVAVGGANAATEIAKLADGDAVTLSGTGNAMLDGKTFVVGNLDASAGNEAFDLLGTKMIAMGTAPTAGIITVTAVTADMTQLCASSLAIDNNPPGTISTATFCTPDSSVPSTVVDLGNVTIGAYHDITDNGFQLLETAAADGNPRTLLIQLPGGGGSMVISGTVSSMAVTDMPIDGAISWEATFAMSSAPKLMY